MKNCNKTVNNAKSVSEWTAYFESLYRSNENETNYDDEISSFLLDSSVPHDLQFPFTCKEVRNGISKLKLNEKKKVLIKFLMKCSGMVLQLSHSHL